MAQTFIGNLILRLQENVSVGARKAAAALRGVDAAARAVGGSGSGVSRLGAQMDALNAKAQKLAAAGWGPSLQARFEKLGASAKELDRLRSSWDQLQSRIASGGLTGKLKSNEIRSWSLTAVGELTRVRAAMKSTEAQARAMTRGMANALKPIYTAAGLGTGAYVGGRLARAGLLSDASVGSERSKLKQSGFNPTQSADIEARARELATRYGLFTGDIMESLREAALGIPNLRGPDGKVIKSGYESAMELSEQNVQFWAQMASIHGKDRATDLTRAMFKSFDVLGMTDPAAITKAMDVFVKMNRIVGKDTDPGQMLLAAKYMRAPGKAFDPGFMYGLVPALMAESSGSDVGTSLRALFSNTMGGRRSKKAQAEFGRFGLIGKDGKLVGQELMNNPALWIESVLKPRLQAKGVDTSNNLELAGILSRLFDNRLSADIAQRFLDQIDQYRDTQERAKNAGGLSAAKDLRGDDPFAGWNAFLSSLQNLASASGLTSAINPALNAIADGINIVANAAGKLSPEAMTGIAVAAGAFATMAGVKAGGTLLALTRAGPELVGAAGELRGAAAALRGGATGDAKKGGGVVGWLTGGASQLLSIVGWAGLAYSVSEALGLGPSDIKRMMEGRLSGAPAERQQQDQQRAEQIRELDRKIAEAEGGPSIISTRLKERRAHIERQRANRLVDPSDFGREAERGRAMSGQSAQPNVDTTSIDAAQNKAASAGAEILKNLGVRVTPTVETSSIDAAIAKARELVTTLQRAGSVGAAVGASIGREIRASQSDYGVAP